MNNRAALLANLGSPASPDVKSVRAYLREFLMDPCVIQLPWVLRKLLVELLIAPFRSPKSARAYQSIWTEEGSPLIALSMELLEALRQRVEMPVAMAMRYGEPSIESQLLQLAAQPGIEEVLLIPLYPHFADSTVATSVREAERVIAKHDLGVKLLVFKPFYDRPDYIRALASCARPWLESAAGFDHIVFSYHSLPRRYLVKTDPTGGHCLSREDCCRVPSRAHLSCYRHQVLRTTECFAKEAGLEERQYSIAFQSRLVRRGWLAPGTEETLRNLAKAGHRKVLVICPAFVTDCLETLEEIALRGKEVFQAAGGESLALIPCLNAHPDWAETLSKWVSSPADPA